MNIFDLFKKEKFEPSKNMACNTVVSNEMVISFTRNDERYKTKYHSVNIFGDNRLYITKDNDGNGKSDDGYMTIEHVKELRDFLNKHLGDEQ